MIQKVLFTSAINTDDSPEYKKGFELIYNCRILNTNDGEDGNITTINGNSLVNFTLPTGTEFKTIGYYDDKLRNKGYYFVWGNVTNFIAEYDQTLNTITMVLKDGDGVDLNFSKDYLIQGFVVEMDAENHLLYWTDNLNEPRKVNIEKALLYTASGGTNPNGYPSPFNPHWIDRIKEPPDAPTYTWSGLNTQTAVVNAGIVPPATFTTNSTSYTTIIYPTASTNVATQYNTTSGVWTCPATGYYNIVFTTNVTYDVAGRVYDVTLALKKNGIAIVPQSAAGISSATSTPIVTFTFQQLSQYFTIGDTLELDIKIDYASVPGGSVVVTTRSGNDSELHIYSLGTSLDSVSNFMFKRLFQFQYDWRYDDKEHSVLSKKTDYILPQTALASVTTGEDFILQDNTITLTVKTGSAIVRKIGLYVKELTQELPSLITVLDKDELEIADDTTYNYTFLNDANYLPVDLNTATQLYDYVFYNEQAIEYFKNRIADANGTEGMDAVNIDMRFPVNYTHQVDTYSTNNYYPKRSYYKSGAIYEEAIAYYANGKRVGNANTMVGKASDMNASNGCFGTQLHIPFLTQSGYNVAKTDPDYLMYYVPTISSYIYHEPPSDAIQYQILRSKQQNISKYLQFTSQNIQYLDYNGDPVLIPADATQIEVDIGNIIGRYKEENGGSQLVYDWTKGDRIRFIAPRKDAVGQRSVSEIAGRYDYNDCEIYAFDTANQKCYVLNGGSLPLNLDAESLFEIYTPAHTVTNDNELVYEVGEGGTVEKDGNHYVHKPYNNGLTVVNQKFGTFTSSTYGTPPTLILAVPTGTGTAFTTSSNVKVKGADWSVYGVVASQTSTSVTITVDVTTWWQFSNYGNSDSGTLVKASEQTFTSGDCFRRYCDMSLIRPYDGLVYRLYMYIETSRASNMFSSDAWDYGRPNRIDNNAKRSLNKARVRYSQQIIPYTNVNGLSTIYDLNFEDYSAQYGGINKLFYQNERLQAYQDLKVLPILVEQQVIQSPEGAGNLTTSPAVLYPQQKIDYYLQDYGIGEHFESFAYFANSKYFFDVKRSAIVRLSQDGLTNISSEAKIRTLIADVCQKILKCETKVNCVGVYDVRFGEYILMIAPFTYDTDKVFTGLTIGFNEKYNQFSSTYGYHGDYLGQTGVDILSFKDGKLYTHNTNTLQNNFYGEQQTSEIWVYLNDNPAKVKVAQAIAQEGLSPFAVEISTNAGQYTHLLDSNFQEKELNWYSEILRDEHTPNILPSPPNPQYLPNAVFEGNVMRDRYFLLKFKYDSDTYNKLFAINLMYTTSERSDK